MAEYDVQKITWRCGKCGRPLKVMGYGYSLCEKCELIETLLVERYGPSPHKNPISHG
jgi:hypothetical protein